MFFDFIISEFKGKVWGDDLEPDAPWPTLDIVYTWVNGSDPILQQQLEDLKIKLGVFGIPN